ncbi:hypothetical protein [Streptomyces sp. NPDC017991]|uniref:hypothetical protein n=1 Tax=Streptomyces sp. NPDC017991 TaxID=3365026 RepID=UPI0037AADC3C
MGVDFRDGVSSIGVVAVERVELEGEETEVAVDRSADCDIVAPPAGSWLVDTLAPPMLFSVVLFTSKALMNSAAVATTEASTTSFFE